MENRKDIKRILNIISTVFVWVLVAVTVGVMIFTLISVNTFDQANRSIFGYKMFIVRSDSMSATDFDAGDIVLIKNVDPSTLKVGDIISFTSQNPSNFGETVTHKIREITTDESGSPAFITYGTTTNTNDETAVTYSYILGKYTGKIPNIGSFFQFLKTTPGYIIFILVPFLLLISYQGFNCVRLFIRYKKEQMAELEEERAKLAEERRQSMEMMKELQMLKAHLAKQNKEKENAEATPRPRPKRIPTVQRTKHD